MSEFSGKRSGKKVVVHSREVPTPNLPDRAADWLEAINTVLGDLERDQAGSRSPIVDHEARVNVKKVSPEILVWLVCRTRAEKRIFADTEFPRNVTALKAKMASVGFSEDAIAGLTVKVTSREEIEANGGRVSLS